MMIPSQKLLRRLDCRQVDHDPVLHVLRCAFSWIYPTSTMHACIIYRLTATLQVGIVRSCGKQLIEDLAAGGDPGTLSQKVNLLTHTVQ